MKSHAYQISIRWTGNRGTGTSDYRSYGRDHIVSADGKPDIPASADPAFRGDGAKYNPEELLLASLSGCHMLWFLHLCADSGIAVTKYSDNPTGIMTEEKDGSGRFTAVTLHPSVTVADKAMLEKLDGLHEKAHELCFIANSVNFPVRLEATANAN